jgi:hypothetical protein
MRRPERVSDWGPVQKMMIQSYNETNEATSFQVLGMFTMNFFPAGTYQFAAVEWARPNGEWYAFKDKPLAHVKFAFQSGRLEII